MSSPSAEARLAQLGSGVDEYRAFPPEVLLAKYVRVDRLLYVSGHLPDRPGKPVVRGRLGREVSVQAGAAAARDATISVLSTTRQAAGSLDRASRIVRLFGMVASTPDFVNQAAVLDGTSRHFIDLWGPVNGRDARSAFGVAQLRMGARVEIEAIAELHRDAG